MSGQETLGLVLPPPGDSSDAHPPQPPAPSVTGQPGPGDPLLCGVSPSLTLLVTLPTGPVTHPQGNSRAGKVPPLQVNTGSAGVALLGICDVYTCVCLFSLKFYTRSGGGLGCRLRPLSCMVPRGLAGFLCCPSGFVPTAAAPQGVVLSPTPTPTQWLGRQQPGAACLLQDWVSSSRFSRQNFVVWGAGSVLLSRLTPEVIPKQRPTALLPLTSSRSPAGRVGRARELQPPRTLGLTPAHPPPCFSGCHGAGRPGRGLVSPAWWRIWELFPGPGFPRRAFWPGPLSAADPTGLPVLAQPSCPICPLLAVLQSWFSRS